MAMNDNPGIVGENPWKRPSVGRDDLTPGKVSTGVKGISTRNSIPKSEVKTWHGNPPGSKGGGSSTGNGTDPVK